MLSKYQKKAIELGLKENEVLVDDNWKSAKIAKATLNYLERNLNNISVSQAMDNIRGLKNEYQIKAIELGLKKEDLKDHKWHEKFIGSETIKYLKSQSRNKPILEAMNNIRGLNNQHKIQAISLGLKKEELEGHDWEKAGYGTISYLKNKSKKISVSQAMDQIRGFDDSYKIDAFGLGLKKEELEGHNWNWVLVGNSTINYLKNRPKNLTLSQAMDQIRGFNNSYKIDAFGLGLKKEELEGHDWEKMGYFTIDYLKNRPQHISVSQAMNNIRGVDNEFKIQAITLGLTINEINGHDWNKRNIGSKTIKYLRNHPSNITISQAMDKIRGLSFYQIEAIELGLEKNQIQDCNWHRKEAAFTTINHLKNRPHNITILQSLDQVRGIDNPFKIRAISLGLTNQDLRGHNWNDKNIGFATINYLENIVKNTNISEAMDKIRGVDDRYKIQAIGLGLNREYLEDHDWEGSGYEAIDYLKNRPKDISALQAMNNIRGLDDDQLKKILKSQKIGIEEFGLTKNQVYAVRFEPKYITEMKKGKTYEEIMPPETYRVLREIDNKKTYIKGACEGLLSTIKIGNIYNHNLSHLAEFFSKHLSIEDAMIISQTSKPAHQTAVRSVERLKEKRLDNDKSLLRS